MNDALAFKTQGSVRLENERGKLIKEVPFTNTLTRAWKEHCLDQTAATHNAFFGASQHPRSWLTAAAGRLNTSQGYLPRIETNFMLLNTELDYTVNQFMSPYWIYSFPTPSSTNLQNMTNVVAYARSHQRGGLSYSDDMYNPDGSSTSVFEKEANVLLQVKPSLHGNKLGAFFKSSTTSSFTIKSLCWAVGGRNTCAETFYPVTDHSNYDNSYSSNTASGVPRRFCSIRYIPTDDPVSFGGRTYATNQFKAWEVDMTNGQWSKCWNRNSSNNGIVISNLTDGTTEVITSALTRRQLDQKFIIDNTAYGVTRQSSLSDDKVVLEVSFIPNVRSQSSMPSSVSTVTHAIPRPEGITDPSSITELYPVMSVEKNESLSKWELVIYQTLGTVSNSFVISKTTWRDRNTEYTADNRVTTYFNCPVAIGMYSYQNTGNAITISGSSGHRYNTLGCPFSETTTNGKTIKGVWLPYTRTTNNALTSIQSYVYEALAKWGTISGETQPKVLDVYKNTGYFTTEQQAFDTAGMQYWGGPVQPVNLGNEVKFIHRGSPTYYPGIAYMYQSEIMSFVNLTEPVIKSANDILYINYSISVQ